MSTFRNLVRGTLLLGVLVATATARLSAQQKTPAVSDQYVKHEYRIPMRDGVKLFTAVYVPRDASSKKRYPILMLRTPYSVAPYGEDRYRGALGPNRHLQRSGYIFVYQDVRGCYMSEGTFVNMRPHIDVKKSPRDIDESSDTYDTIAWLLEHLPYHNGRVGMWGISYPGFYAAAGMIDAHPALKAVSPQAPIADWWYDDFHHHGAFFLPHAFHFLSRFGQMRPKPTTLSAPRFSYPTPDGYEFYMRLGPLANANTRYLRDRVPFWNAIMDHPNYDEFWQRRNLLPHLHRVAPAVLTVGGWFDAEDLYGPLQIYRTVEAKNPGVDNRLVMGPWAHGGWARRGGDHLGNVDFDGKHSAFYQEWIETRFFEAHLKGDGHSGLPEAFVFETGRNRWRMFDKWPPQAAQERLFYAAPNQSLTERVPSEEEAFDEFVSDPNKPVPFTEVVAVGMTREYMTDDQRFAARRPDVLVYQTPPLRTPLTLVGPIVADLWVSTSQGDADWIVKVIDVFPDDAKDHRFLAPGKRMAGYQ
ncbi:MAG TPA: CocE/NonD family hydrolase, partial [Planctomycetaceae bacterium]|nr:CocE/NonD family hydrolase [Planctomycetaceae bacterium]